MSVIDEIAHERARQVAIEGWTPEHDDEHLDGSLADAAACYAATSMIYRLHESSRPKYISTKIYMPAWPRSWAREWFKPKDRRRDLIRAGALIVAEIERLDRLASPMEKEQ